MVESILNEQQEKKLTDYFDTLVARAEHKKPELADFKDPKEFMEREAAYNSNPLLKTIQSYKQELAANGGSEQANALYRQRVDELKGRFISGAKNGMPDPDARQKQEGIFMSLLSGDWMGAIKQFILSIPFVGNFLGGAMKFGRSQFTGEKLNWSQAQERIVLEKALDGAAINMGLGENARDFRDYGVSAYENPNFKKEDRPLPTRPPESIQLPDDVRPNGVSGGQTATPDDHKAPKPPSSETVNPQTINPPAETPAAGR
jgi:hypothetical protein